MTEYIGFFVRREILNGKGEVSHRAYNSGIGSVASRTDRTLALTGLEIRSNFKPAKTLEGLMKTDSHWQPIGRLIYPNDEGVTIIDISEEEYNRLNAIRTSPREPGVIIDSIKYRK